MGGLNPNEFAQNFAEGQPQGMTEKARQPVLSHGGNKGCRPSPFYLGPALQKGWAEDTKRNNVSILFSTPGTKRARKGKVPLLCGRKRRAIMLLGS